MTVQWYIDWLIESGVAMPADVDETASRELELLKGEYGEVPAELEELMLNGFGHTRGLIFPWINGGDLPALLPHDPTNENAVAIIHYHDSQTAHPHRGVQDSYRVSVASGHAPSHPVLLSFKEDCYVALECKGPRAGWVYDFEPGFAGLPSRPIARSLSECFGGFRRMVEAGVLEVNVGGLAGSMAEGAPLPPEGIPMLFLGEVERPYDSLFKPWRHRPVLEGSVRELLGFEVPLADDEPLGLRECFEPDGGWLAGMERVARLRVELGLDTSPN